MNAVKGLSAALKLYASTKVKEREQGSQALREIIGNRANLETFAQASADRGQSWIALFKCLFQTVSTEKTASFKKKSSNAASRQRLADAMSLVRLIAERSVHLITRKPFHCLVTHMKSMLVYDGQIFEPAAIDYAKALRTLLLYPPHGDHLDERDWIDLMNICWAALLDEPVSISGEWNEEANVQSDGGSDAPMERSSTLSASATHEIATLVPILLASSRAPLIPPAPDKDEEARPEFGLAVLRKIYRYLAKVHHTAIVPVEILRSLNILLGELELNSKEQFTQLALGIFPQLVTIWVSRTKGDLGHREHVLVALRTLLPFVTHATIIDEESKATVGESLAKILDGLAKEAGTRAAVKPLDLEALRFKPDGAQLPDSDGRPPFELMGLTAGFGFDAAQAMNWAAVELCGDCCFYTFEAFRSRPSATPSTAPTQTPSSKRRKMTSSLDKLIGLTTTANSQTRVLACQVLVFFVDKHWANIDSDAMARIRTHFLDLLDGNDADIESWAFVGLACLAAVDDTLQTMEERRAVALPVGSYSRQEISVWEKLWSHAIRKTSVRSMSRAACHAAQVVVQKCKVNHALSLHDIEAMLRHVDIQGPPATSESAIYFLTTCLHQVRADAGLYAANLEDKILDWFAKTYSVTGYRNAVGPATSVNILHFLTTVCGFPEIGLQDTTVLEQLPDCPVVNRILQEADTARLRRLILDGLMPESPHKVQPTTAAPGQGSETQDLAFLDGRPRKLSDILQRAVELTSKEWSNTQNTRRAALLSPRHLRKSVDLVVLVFLFQASLHVNGLRPDAAGCLRPAATLLNALLPHLRNLSDNVQGQLLVWRGFTPFFDHHMAPPTVWPVLLRPDRASGIRRDLLPPSRYASFAVDNVGNDGACLRLLSTLWSNEETRDTLCELLQATKTTLGGVRVVGQNGAVGFAATDDDDFGPIINADADVIPQSSEAYEAQHSTTSLLKTLVDLSLHGQQLSSPERRPVKDVNLVNTLITAESARFTQLGFIVCDAIQEESLRLSVDIVDAILTEIEDRLETYVFQRDSEMLRFTMMFLARTACVWLSPDSGLCERAIYLAHHFVRQARSGFSSWQARLQLLLFIDEYLDYDPTYRSWVQYSGGADIEMDDWGPLSYILDSTSDADARVRFRAATSAAGIHYLNDLPSDLKSSAYYDVVQKQGAKVFSWDYFLTNLLWKLNTCIASAQLRAATIFHLYEVADFAPQFLPYLQPGLQAVADRLGLESLQTLYLAHANIVVINQLSFNQLPLSLPPGVYGCTKRKDFAHLCLEAVAPKILAEPALPQNAPFFIALCEAAGVHTVAGVEATQARRRHLPLAAAIAVTQAITDVESTRGVDVKAAANEAVNSLQPPEGVADIFDFLRGSAEVVTANLFWLVDLSETNEAIAEMLENVETRAGDSARTFTLLMTNDQNRLDTAPSLDPAAKPRSVLLAHDYFKSLYPKQSKRRMVLVALINLFHALNAAYLIDEQRRYLRAVALLASLYPTEFAHPIVLQQFLRNVIDLLVMDDISLVALSMLQWGFDRLSQAPKPPSDLAMLMIKLGSAYSTLRTKDHMEPVASGLDSWIADKAQAWYLSDGVLPALETATAFWPAHWVDNFHLPEAHFLEVAEIAKRPNLQDSMSLCRRLVNAAGRNPSPETKEAFLRSTFWNLKQSFKPELWNREGAMAFLNLLYMVDGDVYSPSLDTIKGLTGRSHILELSRRFTGSSRDLLRIAILERMVDQTDSDDYHVRSTAYEVLQTMLPMIKAQATSLPERLHETVTYLVAATPSSGFEPFDIETLATDPNWSVKSKSYPVWSKDLSLLLGSLASGDDDFYTCLHPILAAKGNVAIDLLPLLVQVVLTQEGEDGLQLARKRATALSTHFTQVLQLSSASPQVVEAIIQIFLHLRHFQPPYASGELAYNHWLTIDPLVLSEAAGKCGAFASSLLFLEMAKDRDDVGNQDLDLSNARVQKIMYDIYSNVEDPDGFYGIQNNDVMDSLHRRLDHEQQPLRALGYNLANVEASPGSAAPLVSALRNLHDLGFDTLAGMVMKSLKTRRAAQSDYDTFFLELAWRMGDWDVPITREVAATSAGRFYKALRAVHRERDRDVARVVVDDAIRDEMAHLQQIGIERMTEIKRVTTNLVCLRDVERWIAAPMQQALDQGDFEGSTLSSFVQLNKSFEFNNAERLSATRLSLIRSARARESKNLFGDLLSAQAEGLINLESSCQLRTGQLARTSGNLQAAVNAITAVRQLEHDIGKSSEAAQDEFSQVLWEQGEHSLAIQHVNTILEPLKLLNGDSKAHATSQLTARHAQLLSRMAHWYWLAKLKSAEEIRFASRRAMTLASSAGASWEQQAQMSHDFAVFTDRYYTILSKSPELERLKSYVDRKQGEYKVLEQSMRSTPGSRRGTVQPDQMLEEESQAKADMEAELLRYLVYSLQSYAVSLAYSDKFDDSITRLCSLWLEHDTNEEANAKFASMLERIPTHKFLFLGPQLSAKLFRPTTPTQFNSLLNNLVLRIAQDHPYHILYQVITLASTAAPSSRSKRPPPSSNGRGTAAAEIMASLKADKSRPVACAASSAMTIFANAAVQWCYTDHDKSRSETGDRPKAGVPLQAPSDAALLQCRSMKIPVATVPPPIDLTLKYEGVPTIDRYRSRYKLAGGIHRPSIMTCLDCLGQEHIQLFKGEDEVRQDAVMEQVFEMTNRLLQRDRRTSIRNLKFRTYVVIPLASSSGIIEFVGNTSAIGDWLKEAHTRYRKGIDIPADMFRKNLQKPQERDWSSPKITEIWRNQMTQFHPVMRHFFTEKRREPLAWFTMRLNYARSVAVTSMVGWMVGLGDRHCSNILIDKITGELVHIDFGIVFEEGRKLRIPEKVPFRLTNDIVDGLGITGVDGTFRQCSEHTLHVLRESSELILTVLEVFKHDPLYAWAGDPSKMRRAGGGQVQVASSAGQDKAERVLAAIKVKLGPELSVEYRVNQLIQEARNVDHLSKIFVGWQSWL